MTPLTNSLLPPLNSRWVAPKYRFGVFVLFFSLDFFSKRSIILITKTRWPPRRWWTVVHYASQLTEDQKYASPPAGRAGRSGWRICRVRDSGTPGAWSACAHSPGPLKHCRSLFVRKSTLVHDPRSVRRCTRGEDARCCSDYPVADHLLISWNYNNDTSASHHSSRQ
jgi:hypothetical protein